MQDYNVKIDGKHLFDQAINNDVKIYENISKIATGQGDDYTTDCLLDYPQFKENYKLIAIDLNKQQSFDADPRAIQLVNVILLQCNLRLSTRNCKSFVNVLQNNLIFINIK